MSSQPMNAFCVCGSEEEYRRFYYLLDRINKDLGLNTRMIYYPQSPFDGFVDTYRSEMLVGGHLRAKLGFFYGRVTTLIAQRCAELPKYGGPKIVLFYEPIDSFSYSALPHGWNAHLYLAKVRNVPFKDIVTGISKNFRLEVVEA